MKKEARKGYKMTELGEIPNEWKIKELKDLYTENIRDFGSFSTTKLIEYVDSGIPYLRSENFRENKLIFNSISYITDEVDKILDKSYVYKGNILFTKIGNIGCATVYRGELGERCNSNATIAKIKIDEKLYNPIFVMYFLNSVQCKKQYIGSIVSTPPRINMGEINKLKVFIPRIEEQEKIAEVLSTVDEQIENTEKLIQKNQELKKGLMQQLLTKGIGHTEFKKTELGYIPKEWEVKKLGEIFKLSSGSFLSQKNIIEGEYPVYGGNGISGYHNDYLFDESKLIIGRVGAKCGCIHISNYKSWITDNALYISEKIIDFDNKFMYYLLKYKDLNKYANQNAQPVISGKKIYSINVAFPPYHEQVSIALILLNMDKKIKEYKIRKHNLEELKSGLMQQLFTGKIRVI
ncbi:restriction endonuclease subunit S [Clostridium perfringens]|nr:restriction endonuclease subunit S [Clostridium perfringens]MDK0757298.1 restriction endonuclease subunit S [Clostridium perfringens]